MSSSSAAGQQKQHTPMAILRRRAVVIDGLLYTHTHKVARSRQNHGILNVVHELPHADAEARARRYSNIRTESLLRVPRISIAVTNVSTDHIRFVPSPAKRRTQLPPILITPAKSRAITTMADQAPLNTPAVTMGPPSSIPMLRSKKLPSTRRQSQQQGLRLQWERSKNRLRSLFDDRLFCSAKDVSWSR